ncbi:MAG: double-strand break repair protein AddB [Pikeienuella sp.]
MFNIFDGEDHKPGASRLYALPPGVNFSEALATGLHRRVVGAPAETLARVEIAVNTRRTSRTVIEAFETASGNAGFLPRLSLLDSLGNRAKSAGHLPPIDRIARRLMLTRLVEAMLRARPELGPPGAASALSAALARLLDEMQRDGAPLSSLHAALPAGDGSDLTPANDFAAHWGATLQFLSVIETAWPAMLAEMGAADPETLRAIRTEALLQDWATNPPEHPLIAAGSTGSTVITSDILAAIARLPQGAVVLPGFDFALDADGWGAVGPEHPQFGFARLMSKLGVTPDQVVRWDTTAPASPRARLLAEALRPAPVTHSWRAAIPELRANADVALSGVTLVEAANLREEADVIAIAMRRALNEGENVRAALITPDRNLARRVTAALGRWGLFPDDSGGRPLGLTPPGVFLRQTAAMLCSDTTQFDAVALLALLKHPFTGAGSDRAELRGQIARLEMQGLRDRDNALRLNSIDAILNATARDKEPLVGPLLAEVLRGLTSWQRGPAPLADLIAAHRQIAEAIGGAELWDKMAGRAALSAMERFADAAPNYGDATPAAYLSLLSAAMSEAGDVREEAFRPDPRLAIWGPLEARAQSADLIILGGLNEGIWPASPGADPWLNRPMRAEIGLAPPERRVGLAAHDFLQGASAPQVILTRSMKIDGAPATASRWVQRLTTLIAGIDANGLAEMRARGADLIAISQTLHEPQEPLSPAPRPAPCPPTEARPKRLSVTEIETLIRDPYSIYARHVLGLRPLAAAGAPPDQRTRGTVLHDAVERFITATLQGWPDAQHAADMFDFAADEAISAAGVGEFRAAAWRARLADLKHKFLAAEADRRAEGTPKAVEAKGELEVAGIKIVGKADRIDKLRDGQLAIYDYKAGEPPSKKQVAFFAKQLNLLAVIAGINGLEKVAAKPVGKLAYLTLKGGEKAGTEQLVELEANALANLSDLLTQWADPNEPFLARAAPETTSFESDYAHLSRFGEWSDRSPEAEE